VYEDNRPAVNVSWDNVQEFIETLNKEAGSDLFRLPTDTEWEYAARAGTTSWWFFGEDSSVLKDYAWYIDTADTASQAVATLLPNPWGLHDVYGNVWEWVEDEFGRPDQEYDTDTGELSAATGGEQVTWYVLRGGGWHSDPFNAHSSGRVGLTSEDRGCYIGVRLVMNDL
jgi:formylglycine-generating enzyme required for sulfatase activity